MEPRPALLLFARTPRPGGVKTRLAPRLGGDGASALYEAFIEDAGRTYLSPAKWASVLWAEPDASAPVFERCFPPPWERRAQAAGDLGAKLSAAFAAAFAVGAPVAVAVGADHPALTRAAVEEIFETLGDGARAALVPAEDGGYCAIGLSAGVPLPAVFDSMAWSTDGVLAETVARLSSAGVVHRLLAPAYDVDRPEDLERLGRDLAARDPRAEDFPRATADALRALGQRVAR
ncbi:MAG: TIGR04282 family arsenosugar biosynthesis glycosyltransferase [Syntrophomonadaceae bacterium]